MIPMKPGWNGACRIAAPTYDDGSRRLVRLWLFICVAMAALMVLLGGLTRLTGSGLSMVEWNPGTFLPPLTSAEWHSAFLKYQARPQYRLVNPDLDMAGFRRIFWLEYVHRLWGRLVGVAVVVPLAGFAVRGWIEGRLAGRLLGIVALGGLQGVMGWLMVASGLVDRPEVSHFRLGAHLVMGFLIFGALLWTALDEAAGAAPSPRIPRKARRALAALLVLVLVTATWGAFVAGLKAGLVYETFPLMDGHWLPPEGRDILRDPGPVQFVHRLLAASVVLTLSGLWLWSRRWPGIPRRAMAIAAGWSWVQASLGVATLLNRVPIPLAAAHQVGALALFALAIRALHGVRRAER